MSLPIVLAITKKAATPHKAAPARKLNDLHKNDRKKLLSPYKTLWREKLFF